MALDGTIDTLGMRAVVAFSGGIDSTALALLREDAVPVFTDTGWEFPHVYTHIAAFEEVTGRDVVRVRSHKGTLPDTIRQSLFMPSPIARFCTREFKIEPMNKFLKAHLPCELLIGLRADEPERVGNLTMMEGLTIRYPLREAGMTRADCVALCMAHDLLPRYPVYAARGGCVGCFYKRRTEVQAMIALIPEVVDELQALEEEIQDERSTPAHLFYSAGMSIANMRAQMPMFAPEDVYDSALVRDDMGVACGLFCNR